MTRGSDLLESVASVQPNCTMEQTYSWRRRDSEKDSDETESSGSFSSYSGRFSDDQEVQKGFQNQNHLPEVAKNVEDDSVKSLTEKLAAAHLKIHMKERLVKQQSKVAEEAVLGWEKAEAEVATLKNKLEEATQKNLSLENQVSHLDDALRECVQQLRQSREKEEKINDVLTKKTQEFESLQDELKAQVIELQAQVQASKSLINCNHDLQSKLEAVNKENSVLRIEMVSQLKELEDCKLEREMSTKAAETASKLHLNSTKKASKLEIECRRLRDSERRAPMSQISIESFRDNQSDCKEPWFKNELDQLLAVKNDVKLRYPELNRYELDQFKNDKAIANKNVNFPCKIDLMDDFLEMERLAGESQSSNKHLDESKMVIGQYNEEKNLLKIELEAMIEKVDELENVRKMLELEKAELTILLSESRHQFEIAQYQFIEAEGKLEEFQKKLHLENESKNETKLKLELANVKLLETERQLQVAEAEIRAMHAKFAWMEMEAKEQKTISENIAAKCWNMENELLRKKEETELRKAFDLNGEFKIKQEEELAMAAEKLAECQETIASLGRQLKSLAAWEDLLLDDETKHGHSPQHLITKTVVVQNNGRIGMTPPLSSSITNHVSEKKRKGFRKLYSK